MTIIKSCHYTDPWSRQAQPIKHLINLCLIVLLATFLMLPEKGWANNTLMLADEDTQNIPLGNFLEFYDPSFQKPDINTITQLDDEKWRSIKEISPTLILSFRQALWFRLFIDNNNKSLHTLVLNNKNPVSDNMSVYTCIAERYPDCEKIMQDEINPGVTYISIYPETKNIIYIEIIGFHSAFPAIALQSLDYFKQQQYDSKLYSGIVDGIILGLTLYVFLLAIKTRQPMHYSYCLLGTCNLLTILLHQNLFSSHILFINNEWKTNLSLVIPLLATSSLAQFIRDFIETKKHHPSIDNFLYAYIIFNIFIASAFLMGTSMAIVLPTFIVASSVTSALMFYLCIINKKHLRSSMIVLAVGISMPILSGFLVLLMALGMAAFETGYMNTMQTFDVIEMMMFSLAMLSSVKHLENEHRRQAESAVEANIISEAHNRLLAHLNHELRTPLNGIIGAAEILVHKSHPRDRHIFSMICHTALPLKHLIDEMVNIKSVTENRKDLQNIRFDLQSLLQECMDVFLPIANEKHIRLFFTVEHDIANDVTGDPNRLRQILLNLIGNACKFTADGEVGLHVKKQSTLSGGKCLYRFEVTDSGMGISKADEQKLFRVFETGNSASNPKGAGLGLSIVRELSELLGGSCGYGNNETVGSKFWFSATLEPHQQIFRKTHKAFENLNVLIADESQSICSQISHQIASITRKIITANSSKAIQLALESENFDVAIIHHKILSNELAKNTLSSKTFFIIYADQNELLSSEKTSHINHEDSIIRKTSTEAFSLQIAECIIKKSNILYKNISKSTKKNSRKILAADDIISNQNIIRELITSLNFTPVICSNGKQAFELYLKHVQDNSPFDAIIMDCEMPIQDGFETSMHIRRYEKEHNIKPTPIIALTAHTETAYRQRSEEAGMSAYLTKPVTAERILQCLIDAENT
jgi:signal transduction histidine kinase/CheY-like chemotaxis protein